MVPPTGAGLGATRSRPTKLDDVTALLSQLRADLRDKNLKPSQRDQTLEQLKVHGRDVNGADPIFEKQGIETLARYAFDSDFAARTSREALRCLANALLLKETTRQMLVDFGCAPKAAEKLKTESSDDEFLLSRILFLMTYGTNVDYERLIKENGLASSINNCIARHSKRYSKGFGRLSQSTPMDDMALNEMCKLMFNITHFHPDLGVFFSKTIPNLIHIFHRSKITKPPLDPPLASVINALINLDLAEKSGHTFSRSSLFPRLDSKSNAEHLVNVLNAAISHYKPSELDHVIAPVITLLRKIYAIAPDTVKRYLEFLLLPTDAERAKPLGSSDTLSARLLRLTTSAATPTLRTSISAMLFELSDSNANQFVQNVGYGFAAGFLMSQNIPVPKSINETFSKGTSGPINPITGQKLAAEPVDEEPPMTEEEKEREAERLFVLFERLKKTGVVDVKNPVEEALRKGRFEELPDDYDDGDDKTANNP